MAAFLYAVLKFKKKKTKNKIKQRDRMNQPKIKYRNTGDLNIIEQAHQRRCSPVGLALCGQLKTDSMLILYMSSGSKIQLAL